ncbi:hypothetical protein JCM16303_001599 [Sporobolomyces ruberrimus]
MPAAMGYEELVIEGNKRYRCDVEGCSTHFTRSTDISRHNHEVHVVPSPKSSEVNQLTCHLCLASFASQLSLTRHVTKLHSSREGREECERCQSTWIRHGDRTTAKRHSRFECPVQEDGQVRAGFEWDEELKTYIRKSTRASSPPEDQLIETPPLKPSKEFTIGSSESPSRPPPRPRPQTKVPAKERTYEPPTSGLFSSLDLPSDIQHFWSTQDYSSAYFNS